MNHRQSFQCSILLILASSVLAFQPLLRFPGIYSSTSAGSLILGLRMTTPPLSSQINQECFQDTTLIDVPDDVWDSYERAMTEVMQSTRVMKKDKAASIRVVQDYLISRQSLPCVPSPMQLDQQGFQEAMSEQASNFQKHYNFTLAQYNFAMRSLVYFGDSCAKNELGLPVTISWHKLKEAGMIPREHSISTYMYILSTQEDLSLCRDILNEVAVFHDLVYAPNERTVFLRMKNMIANNDVVGAEGILFSLPDKGEGGEWKRLRTFLPVLEYYCAAGDASSILRIFRGMRNSPGVYLDADTYAMIIGSLARFGWFREDSSTVEGFDQCGFTSSHGAGLFDEIATEMASDILELTESASKQIMDAFLVGFTGKTDEEPTIGDSEIPRVSGTSDMDGLHIGRVHIDQATGLCPASGAKLRLFGLDEDQRQHVHDTLLEMARLSYQEFTKNRERGGEEDQDFGFQQLSRFSEWLK